MSNEIAVVAIAIAKPGRAAQVERVIRGCVGPTREEAGCLLYTVHTDVRAPERFVFIERWASREALSAHEQQPHFLAMAEAFQVLLTGPLQILVLQELS
jgi:quinol monooxygenase YgiN